jgi:hypothetical protein
VVIATTLRLFVHRRLPVVRRWLVAQRWWGVSAVAAVVAVAVAAASVLLVVRPRADPRAAPRRLPGVAGLSAAWAAGVRREAARWVAGQVGRGAVVACDPVMCGALRAQGFPVRNLRLLAGPAQSPRGSAVVVSAAELRGWFGTRIADAWAPVVAASFGAGSARVQVRVTAPAGAAAYKAALRADWRARAWAGQQLLTNPHVMVTGVARGELAGGLVDARLMITLAALATIGPVRVAAFGDAGPQATPGQPLRAMVLASPGGPRRAQAGYLRSLLAFAATQRAQYRPMSAQLAERSGQPVLVITFAAPSPLGLLGPAAYQNLDGW